MDRLPDCRHRPMSAGDIDEAERYGNLIGGWLGVDRPGVTNSEILEALRKVPQPSFAPGATYAYSNSGYVLLALIIRRLPVCRWRGFSRLTSSRRSP